MEPTQKLPPIPMSRELYSVQAMTLPPGSVLVIKTEIAEELDDDVVST